MRKFAGYTILLTLIIALLWCIAYFISLEALLAVSIGFFVIGIIFIIIDYAMGLILY